MKSITAGAVNCEVTVQVAGGVEIVAMITKHSVEDLAIDVGSPVVAPIKSSHVILAVE